MGIPTGHWERRKVTEFVVDCEVKIMNHVIKIDLNVLPLGSYDMIINMDWLAKHKVILNCFDKTFTYMVEDWIITKVEGVIKPVSLRQISVVQLKKCIRKGCKLYAVWFTKLILNEGKTQVKYHPVLSKFMDVFPEEIPRLPCQGEIDFSIEIVPGFAPVSNIPYRMRIPELTKLKI